MKSTAHKCRSYPRKRKEHSLELNLSHKKGVLKRRAFSVSDQSHPNISTTDSTKSLSVKGKMPASRAKRNTCISYRFSSDRVSLGSYSMLLKGNDGKTEKYRDSGLSTEGGQSDETGLCAVLDKIEAVHPRQQFQLEEKIPAFTEPMKMDGELSDEKSALGHSISVLDTSFFPLCDAPYVPFSSFKLSAESFQTARDKELSEKDDCDSDRDSRIVPTQCVGAQPFWTFTGQKEAKQYVDIHQLNNEGTQSAARKRKNSTRKSKSKQNRQNKCVTQNNGDITHGKSVCDTSSVSDTVSVCDNSFSLKASFETARAKDCSPNDCNSGSNTASFETARAKDCSPNDCNTGSNTNGENNAAHCSSARTIWTPADWKESKKSVDILRSTFKGFDSAARKRHYSNFSSAKAQQDHPDKCVSQDSADLVQGQSASVHTLSVGDCSSSSVDDQGSFSSAVPKDDDGATNDSETENDAAHCFSARTFWNPTDWKEVKKSVDILQSNYTGFESAAKESQSSNDVSEAKLYFPNMYATSQAKCLAWRVGIAPKFTLHASSFRLPDEQEDEESVSDYLRQRGVRILQRSVPS